MTTEVAGSPVDGQRVLSVQKFEVDPPTNLSQELVDPENTFATTKEEEWITKKKTELTTTRQIETRVKRQVVLEDGKVVEDSGPIVTTNTTEDTEKQEHKQTEHRTLGGDDALDPDWVAVPSPASGLVKEVKERKVTSREEREERVETEDVQHLGDITDEAYLEAIKNQQDLREALRSPVPGETGGELVASSRIVSQSSKGRKIIDTEDSVEVSQVQEDGRLVTEKRHTTEHEEIREDEEPDDDPTGVEENKETHRESSHRFAKTRDQDLVEYVADGVKIGEEMRYMAENVEAEHHGDDPMDQQDWESLSTRIRRMRRQSKGHRGAPGQAGLGAIGGPLAMDRKDALTKKPLDFDQEEETRKVETSKWLEHHFGSDSRSSKDSIDDDELVPSAANGPSTSFINVTMKSRPIGSRKTAANNGHASSNSAASPSSYIANVSSSSRVFVSSSPEEPDIDDRRRHGTNGVSSPSGGYFHGVSEWSERRINESGRNSANLAVPPHRPDRVQVLPTGANHTFSKPRLGGSTNHLDRVASPSPVVNGHSPSPFQSNHNSSSHRNNSYESTINFLAAERNGGASSPVPRYVNRDSPSNLHRVSSPHQRSSSPYHHKGSRTVQQQTVAYNGNHHEEEELHNGYRRGHSPQPPQRRRHSEREELDERYIKNRTRYRRSREGNDGEEEPEEEVEPPPDYSPPPAQPSPSPSPSPENAGRDTPSQTTVTPVPSSLSGNKKLYQRTRFAADIPPPPSRHPPPSRSKSPGHSTTSKIGESLRKFVGKFRSSSTERKNKQHRRKRSPSPRQPSSSTYQQYHVIDNNIPSVAWSKGGEETRPNEAGHSAEGGESPRQPLAPPRSSRGDERKECGTQTAREMSRGAVQRFYLGEDPFGGSIYGREREYDGVTPRRRHHHRQNGHHSSGHRRGSHDEDDMNRANLNSSSTLGRLSKSTSRLVNSSGSDMGRATQTLPRKLHRAPAPPAASNSMINVSIVNHVTGPAKPARTYKSSLSRSKSFNVHGGSDTETSSSLLLGSRDRNRDAFKSNPHLHRLDESPPPLKSPGILASISRSQRDLTRTTSASPDRDDYDYERNRRQESSHRFSKSTSNLIGNGYSSSQETKKKIFMKGLMDRAPELYKTLHGDEEIPKSPSPSPGSRLFTTSTPLKNGSRVLDYSSSFRSSSTNATPPPSSPYRSNLTVNGVGELGRTTSPKPSYTSTLTHTPYRDTKKTSMTRRGSDDYSETVRITSKSDDPIHPSITNTVQSFSKKTVPTKSGRSTETIESSETTTVTKSRFRGGNADKYLENGNYSMRNGHAGGVVIEVRPSRK